MLSPRTQSAGNPRPEAVINARKKSQKPRHHKRNPHYTSQNSCLSFRQRRLDGHGRRSDDDVAVFLHDAKRYICSAHRYPFRRAKRGELWEGCPVFLLERVFSFHDELGSFGFLCSSVISARVLMTTDSLGARCPASFTGALISNGLPAPALLRFYILLQLCEDSFEVCSPPFLDFPLLEPPWSLPNSPNHAIPSKTSLLRPFYCLPPPDAHPFAREVSTRPFDVHPPMSEKQCGVGTRRRNAWEKSGRVL